MFFQFSGQINRLVSYNAFYIQARSYPVILNFKELEQLVLSSYDKDCLDLSSKNLDDEHMLWLLDILTAETAKKILCFSDNKIGDLGARRLSELLRKFPQISSIRLQRNNIGPEGAQYLINAAATNNNLIEIALVGNGLEKNILDGLEKRLEVNSQIQQELKKASFYRKISQTLSDECLLPCDLITIILDYYNDASNGLARKYLKNNLYPNMVTLDNYGFSLERKKEEVKPESRVSKISLPVNQSNRGGVIHVHK